MDSRPIESYKHRVISNDVWTKCGVLLASVMCQIIINTCQLSFLRLYQAFLEDKSFHQAPDISYITLSSSVVFLISSCIYGGALHRGNINKISIYSSLLSFGALFVGSFSRNVDYFVLSASLFTGIGLSGLHLASIVALSLTFNSRFPSVLGLVLCISKASHFIHEPLTDLLISTYNWDGTCQILAALCLNGVVCGLIFNAPHNIKIFGLEWFFGCPNFKINRRNNIQNLNVVDFKNSYVIRSILKAREKATDDSNKSLDGCIITNSNTIIRPSSSERLSKMDDTSVHQSHNDFQLVPQYSHITLANSLSSLSYCSLESYFHAEIIPSALNYCKVSQDPPNKEIPSHHPSKERISNILKTFKSISFLVFNASFVLFYIGIFITSSFLMRWALSQDISMEDIHLIYLFSTCSEMFHSLSVGLILQVKRLQVTVFYSGLLLSTGLLLVSLRWAVHTASIVTFTLLFGFSKAGQTMVRTILLRRLYGRRMFVQTYCLSHLFEAVAAIIAPLAADTMKEHLFSFETVFAFASVILFVGLLFSFFIKYLRRKEEITKMMKDTKK